MFEWMKRGTFYGGIFLASAKFATESMPIQSLPLPERLFLPLPESAEVVIGPQQRVQKHQCLAYSGCRKLNLYSPVDGTIVGSVNTQTVYHSDQPALELAVEQDKLLAPVNKCLDHLEQPSDDVLVARLVAASLVGQGGKGSPLTEKIQEAKQRHVEYLIIGGMESEPCLTADYRALIEYPDLIFRGIFFLHHYLKPRRTFLALDQNHRHLLREYYERAWRSPIRVVGLSNRYPQGLTPLLIQSLLGFEVPLRKTPLDVGVLVLNVSSVLHIARALVDEIPLTARIVTVSGDAVERPGNYWVPNGAPIEHILRQVGLRYPPERLIVGGPMTGRAVAIENTILTLRCPALLAFSSESVDRRSPQACVRCGWCLEACPVQLNPADLLQVIELQKFSKAKKMHVDACLECGLCSYVCPSALPLAGSIIKTKKQWNAG